MFVDNHLPKTLRLTASLAILFALSITTGCTTVLAPIEGIPVSQLPDHLLGIRRSDYVPVPVVMLAKKTSDPYLLDSGDILGVYIDGVLPFSAPATIPEPPPVQFPDAGSDLPPSIGYPIPIQEGGLINLPLLKPFSVTGLTVDQARDQIDRRYREEGFLRSEETMPIVSLIRKRQNNILVVRANAGSDSGNIGTSAGYDIRLNADRSHVLAALNATGGLPGFNEKNELVIYKTARMPESLRQELTAYFCNPECAKTKRPFIPCQGTKADEGCFSYESGLIEDSWILRIPLRVPPGQIPNIETNDIVLDDGDILQIESRETELFYTGGMLRGGQFPLPRDYDLDVLGALALAGQGIASTSSRGGGGGGGGGGGMMQGLGGTSPTQLYIIRKLPCGRTFNIAVDLQMAMNDSKQNILVQPGDTLILRYKPHEELANFGIGAFFTFGISELFRGD